tara:strand:- start:411 stop:950 length:540 start_codon:yes stop_codon:yes gene_type:complete
MKEITPLEHKPNHRIFVKNGKVYKSLHKGLICNSDWLEAYRTLYKENKNLVKVYDVTNEGKMIVMEKLDVICNLEELFKAGSKHKNLITKDLICETISVLSRAWAIDFEYSKTLKGHEYFTHDDLKLCNLVLTSDYQIKFIDPDSYGFSSELESGYKFIQVHVELMHRIQRYYNNIKDV